MRKTPKEKQEHARRAQGLLCVREAAKFLGKSRRTINRMENAGKMPPRVSVTYGTRTYFRLADIEAMAAAAHARNIAGDVV